MTAFGGAFVDTRILITGHSGFKGSWLSLWLSELGARVVGIALPVEGPSHWKSLRLPIDEYEADVREPAVIRQLIRQIAPNLVFHLAAQSLVRTSYEDPLATWSTNVLGTANVLEACRDVGSIRAIVVATSDKCYENRGWPWAYRESDQLGGHDPYSASKGATELVAASYRRAFFQPSEGPLLATVRAGNVIGGGDWAKDRLVPDAIRAAVRDRMLVVRSPDACRPWQHVLDCLSGYLLVAQRMLRGDVRAADAWNFGPIGHDDWRVQDLLDGLAGSWPSLRWQRDDGQHPHEASVLRLDVGKAATLLDWRPVWTLPDAIAATAEWYRTFTEQGVVLSREQLARYVSDAQQLGATWARD